MNLMVYALGLEESTRYFDVLHSLFEHFMSIVFVSDFCLPVLHLIEEDDFCGLGLKINMGKQVSSSQAKRNKSANITD